MPSVIIHPRPKQTNPAPGASDIATNLSNPLPQLLQTPSGLAIVEVQGTFNLPNTITGGDAAEAEAEEGKTSASVSTTTIGRLAFPLYDASSEADDGVWMKQVYLYIGKHQRMTGEVKKLAKPLAILRRRQQQRRESTPAGAGAGTGAGTGTVVDGGVKSDDAEDDDLEIAEIVRYKVLFAHRPEPVGVEEVV